MISLTSGSRRISTQIQLPSSKSESNRALIIQALSREKVELSNLSSARDTQTMIRLLQSEGHVLDVIDAGTTMRFLTAYFCAVGRDQILTGTPRMCKRPIGILVDALRELGAEIDYWKQEGFPPLHIISRGSKMEGGEISLMGNVSSQYISALLMIAPVLPGGLVLNLTGEISSRPYIEMTRSIMAHFGVETRWSGQSVIVPQKAYEAKTYTIESDWSAASYWYSVAALSEDAQIKLLGLRKHSWQGDQKIADFMEYFGVKTSYTDEGVELSKSTPKATGEILHIDFSDTPDLAQTIAVVSAATGIAVRMSGIHTLRIKETDRIAALKHELEKFSVDMEVDGDICTISGKATPAEKSIKTYEDHRMAMAFAPMVFRQPSLMINDPDVVGKSYPEFWQHLEKAGVSITEW